jgi:pimeloyl-ACP methyl ester carboxylesterase
MTVHFTSKDGTQIGCTRYGSGPPLVLVHGATADHTRWAPILSTLEQHFTVYACDRRGRGESGDAAEYSLEREVEDVVAIVDGIGGPVDLLGHSYGALLSLEASRRAKHLRKLVLYEPPIIVSEPFVADRLIGELTAALARGEREEVVAQFLREGARVPPDQLALMQSLPAWKARVAAAHTIPRELHEAQTYRWHPEQFAAVSTPTLLLLGGASPPPFRYAIEAVHAGMASSRIAVLPGQHHVAIDTAPELFLRETLGFLL